MRNKAITNALLDFADQKAGLGENLATLSQVLGLITKPGGSLVKLVKEIAEVKRNRKFWPYLRKSARDIRRNGLNEVASQYLTYVYGWKPLMQDIYGTMEVAKQAAAKPLILHASTKAHEQTQSSEREYMFVSENTRAIATGMDIDTLVRASLYARVDPDYQGLRALNQLGLLNPVSLLWELVPYSFVVDWVLPIGPVLQALTAPAGLTFVNGSISSRVKAGGPYTLHRETLTGDADLRLSQDIASEGVLRYEGYVRETITNWPRPGFWFDSDPLRGDRSFKALALAIVSLPR
jgi:hypothetical protein